MIYIKEFISCSGDCDCTRGTESGLGMPPFCDKVSPPLEIFPQYDSAKLVAVSIGSTDLAVCHISSGEVVLKVVF